MRNQFFPLLVSLLFVYIEVSAQNPDGNNFNSYFTDPYANIVPPTPNAANFMQYGNTPVNASSGLPSISIPIFTIEEDGVQVPISLSYNASGIRVDDISSTVGLKWTLNAGGMISRTINDIDDFADSFGWVESRSDKSHFDKWLDENYPYNFSDAYYRRIFQELISRIDNHPDNFNYNFLNYSGSFVFTSNYDMFFSDYTDKIIEGNTSRESLELLDLYGNEFHFQNFLERNVADTYFYGEGDDDYNHQREESIASWMLNIIKTKNEKIITFDYDEYPYYDDSFYSQQLVTAYGYNCQNGFPFGSEDEGSVYFQHDKIKSTRIKNNTVNQLIRHIYTDNVEVEFLYVEGPVNGMPVSGWDKRIDRILIKDKIQNKQKEFQFTYGTYSSQEGKGRLKLWKVQEKGFDGTFKPPYVFSYNESNPLPKVGSFAKDYKGYYNGKNTNKTLFPKTEKTLNRKQVYNYPGEPPFILYPGNDKLSERYFDENYLKTGVLTNIHYPTGGRTEFTYEPNAIGVNAQEPLLVKNSFTMSNDFNEETGLSNQITKGRRFAYSQIGEINNFAGGLLEVNLSGACPECGCLCIAQPAVLIYEYEIGSDDEGEIFYDANHLKSLVAQSSLSLNGETTIFAPTGDYNTFLFMIVLGDTATRIPEDYDPPNGSSGDHMYLTINWHEKVKDTSGNTVFQQHYFGGLRIKEIKDFDESGTSYNLTKYNYLEGSTDNPFDSYKCFTNPSQPFAGQFILTPDPQWLPGTQVTNGYYYSHVEIEKIHSNTYGKTEEFYLPKYDFYNLSAGDLFKRKVFDREYNLLQLDSIDFVTSEPYEYNFQYHIPSAQDKEYFRAHDCVILDVTIHHNWPVAGYTNNVFSQHYSGGWRLPKSTRSTHFFKQDNNSEPITTVTTYNYTDEFLLEKETIDTRYTATMGTNDEITGYVLDNPNGEVIETDYQYAKEFKPNIIPWTVPDGLSVSKEVFNGTTKVGGQYYEYDVAGNIKNTYRYNKGGGTHTGGPSYVPQNYEFDISYLTDQGKPTEVKSRDGIYVSYIWGYGDQYPIAKIVNASNQSIASTLGISISTLLGYNESNLPILNSLRTSMPSAQITTFTYSPLVGITSVTDPKGYKMSYYYDGLGRLEYVKDQNDKVLGKNEYNYKN